MTIDVIIGDVEQGPSQADPVDFDNRADAFVARLHTLPPELNTWAQQANALRIEVNQGASDASNNSNTAQSAASIAVQKAAEASADKDSVTAMAAAVQAAAGLPALAGNAKRRLTVNATGDGVEWAGGFAYPAYINNTATGSVDLDLKAATVFELTLTGDITLNAINLPAGNERSIAYLNGTNLGGYDLTSNIDFTGVALLSGHSVSKIKKTGRTFTSGAEAGTEITAIRFNTAGDKLVMMGKSGSSTKITVYNCNQGLDTVTLHSSFAIDNAYSGLDSFEISNDGTTLIVRKWSINEVAYWNFSTPWNATTLTKTGVVAPSHYSSIGYIYAIAFTNDGSRFYAADGDSSLIWWDLPSAFDISSIASGPDGNTQITSSNMGLNSLSILPNHDGLVVTNAYNDETNGRRLEKWAFPSVSNPVGATRVEVSPSLYGDMNVPHHHTFMDDGSRVAVFGNTTTLHEYDIKTSQIITLHQVGSTMVARGA
jgi:hypothetical protein